MSETSTGERAVAERREFRADGKFSLDVTSLVVGVSLETRAALRA